jgi:ParB family chromosome partitioning protein
MTSAEDIESAARYVVSMSLSVRKTEAFVARKLKRRIQARRRVAKKGSARSSLDSALSAIEENLKRTFATQVRIVPQGDGGKIEIEYYSQAELERLLETWGAL